MSVFWINAYKNMAFEYRVYTMTRSPNPVWGSIRRNLWNLDDFG